MSMSNAVYRCKSCKTRVTMAMSICPICGEPITPQTALLQAGSGSQARVVMRHNTAAETSFIVTEREPVAEINHVASQPIPAPELSPLESQRAHSPTLQQLWDEMATPEAVASVPTYPTPLSQAKVRAANRSFALYVACVVMMLVGSFLIGIGLARRYTASEQAAQNAITPSKVIVVQPSAGVGGPLPAETENVSK
jgi:hypothetical protein